MKNIFIGFAFLIGLTSNAQTKLEGYVGDADTGSPFVDVSVFIDNIFKTKTDNNGFFVLETPSGLHEIKLTKDGLIDKKEKINVGTIDFYETVMKKGQNPRPTSPVVETVVAVGEVDTIKLDSLGDPIPQLVQMVRDSVVLDSLGNSINIKIYDDAAYAVRDSVVLDSLGNPIAIYTTREPIDLDSFAKDSLQTTQPIEEQTTVPTNPNGAALVIRRRDDGSEAALIGERKNAVQQVTNIGAEELSQKSIGDAEEAVSKTAGVTKQVGVKNVFVRGLGDRYNSTSLNGFPLPSDDPDYKNISLDIFSSDIITSLDIDKTFNPNFYGDVAGANINIKSKEHLNSKPIVSLSVSSGFNSEALSSDFKRIDGSNYLGLVENRRSIGVNNASEYNFDNKIQPTTQSSQLNSGASFQLGNSFQLGRGKLNALLIGEISSGYRFLEGVNRQVSAVGDFGQNLDYNESEYNTSQLAFLNLLYKASNKFNINVNSGLIHTNSQEVGEYRGQSNSINDDPSTGDVFILRQQQNDNYLFVNQLISNFKFDETLSAEFGVAYNYETSAEPDTKTNSFTENGLGTNNFFVSSTSPGAQQRLGIQLLANDLNARFKIEKQFGDNKNNKLQLGYNYRNYNEDFKYFIARQLFNNGVAVDLENIDAVFTPSNINQLIYVGGFNIPNNEPGFYNANKTLHSAFTDFQFEYNSFAFDFGIRLDNIDQTVDYNFEQAQGGAENIGSSTPIQELFILPSFSSKYNFSKNSIARLSGSKTYILPRFKEVAPFLYQTVAFNSFGRDLTFSDVYNLDTRYEYYFSSDELVSVTGYYKHILNPINRIGGIQAAGSLSYANLKEASVYGLEIELKKKLIEVSKNDLKFGLIFSYLFSEQTNELSEDNLGGVNPTFTNQKSQIEGAAPIILNTDLAYSYAFSNGSKLSFVSLLNYASEKIFSIGTQTLNDITQNQIITLDFIGKYSLKKNWDFNLSLKNLLNPTYKLQQETTDDGEAIDVLTFKQGIGVSAGLNFKF